MPSSKGTQTHCHRTSQQSELVLPQLQGEDIFTNCIVMCECLTSFVPGVILLLFYIYLTHASFHNCFYILFIFQLLEEHWYQDTFAASLRVGLQTCTTYWNTQRSHFTTLPSPWIVIMHLWLHNMANPCSQMYVCRLRSDRRFCS